MGFFDRLAGKPASSTPEGGNGTPSTFDPSVSGVAPRLIAAREKLDAKDLKGALAIYEELLATSGDRADVLVTISGDLGSTGHIPQIIELVAPRYDATRHGPAAGINLIQAYLAVRDADAARHVLDILFALQKPELEGRLHGFSNAIAELVNHGDVLGVPEFMPAAGEGGGSPPPPTVGLAVVTISKPVWSYGLESFGDILPAKEGKLRRVAFGQLALPGAYADVGAAMNAPEDEMGRLSRAIPLWFAETFYYSPLYSSVAALGCLHDSDGSRRPAIFTTDWTVDNMKKLVESVDGLDYIFTGTLVREGAEHVLTLKVWEVKKYKERKEITARWTAETADAELTKLHEYVRAFMEWAPYPEGAQIPYSAPSSPTAWLEALGTLLSLFLIEKDLLPKALLGPLSPVFDSFAPHTFSPPASSLAWISLRSRAKSLGLEPSMAEVMLSSHPAVARARALISS
ncbi:MAG TPA: hypothetical protein VII43_07030 [Opitutaceae bacterium]